MQDVGNNEDTELSREDLTLSWREFPVESIGHCQSVGNGVFFRRGLARNELTYLYPPVAYHLFSPYIAVAFALGQIPLELWLIVMAVNVQRWKQQASAAGERQ